MSRRLAALTLDTAADLPTPCRSCIAWELDPVAARAAREAGGVEIEKESWLSAVLLEWGSCGRIAYVDDEAGRKQRQQRFGQGTGCTPSGMACLLYDHCSLPEQRRCTENAEGPVPDVA